MSYRHVRLTPRQRIPRVASFQMHFSSTPQQALLQAYTPMPTDQSLSLPANSSSTALRLLRQLEPLRCHCVLYVV